MSGTGRHIPGSIMVRMLSFEDVNIDAAFWQSKIQGAYAYRQNILKFPSSATNAFRLIHGEGDGVPGLIIDIYGKVAVVQCHTAGTFRCLPHIVNALTKVLGDQLTTVYNKSKESLGGKTDITDGVLWGSEVESDIVTENGHLFNVNWVEGQKPASFLISAITGSWLVSTATENRAQLFFLHRLFRLCSQKGATSVVSVDISSRAVAPPKLNASLNHCNNHEGITANVPNTSLKTKMSTTSSSLIRLPLPKA